MKKLVSLTALGAAALLPSWAMVAAPAVDKADNAFMMISTALVLFMTLPGIALFYGGLLRGKNVLSMLTQVAVRANAYFGLILTKDDLTSKLITPSPPYRYP